MKFVIEHRARRTGKTHELVDRSISLLLNGKRDNLILYTLSKDNLKAILSVNNRIDHKNLIKKPFKGGELWEYGNKNIYIITHFKEQPQITEFEKCPSNFLLGYDEFPCEIDLKESAKILGNLRKVGSDNVIILTTSFTSGFSKTIFDVFRQALEYRKDLDLAMKDAHKTLYKHFKKEKIEDDCKRIMKTCYAFTEFIVDQKVENTLFEYARNITDKTGVFSLDSCVKSSHNISRDFFGMFFENKAMAKAGYRSYEEVMKVLKEK